MFQVQEVAAPMSNLQILHKENEELRSHLEERDRVSVKWNDCW
jgi:hypothetical protein